MSRQINLQEIAEIMTDYETGIELDLETLIAERIPSDDLSEFITLEVLKRSPNMQASVLKIFAKAGHREVLSFIEPLLSNKALFAKLYVATALAHLGDHRGFQILEDIALHQSINKQDPNYIPLSWVLECLEEVDNAQARKIEGKLRG
jgi:hypothetical protein